MINKATVELFRFLGKKIQLSEKDKILFEISDFYFFENRDKYWFFEPLANGNLPKKHAGDYIFLIESIYTGIECGHFEISNEMLLYLSAIYFYVERLAASGTSIADMFFELVCKSDIKNPKLLSAFRNYLVAIKMDIDAHFQSDKEFIDKTITCIELKLRIEL